MTIPIDAAKRIAQEFGYDQIVIIARKVGPDGGEHVTTYGEGPEHRKIAAHIGQFLKYKVMGWPECKHANTEAAGAGFAVCLDCGILMPDEMNFWDNTDTEATWPK